jgi:hypothetical protein
MFLAPLTDMIVLGFLCSKSFVAVLVHALWIASSKSGRRLRTFWHRHRCLSDFEVCGKEKRKLREVWVGRGLGLSCFMLRENVL